MANLIPRAFIDELLIRVDLVDLIDKHVPLKKTGSNYVARCPFHNEKTPSFSVSRSKQFYHCFGCGVSGNAISFLMDYLHLGFVEAVEDLAGEVGLQVPREVAANNEPAGKRQQLQPMYDLLQQVAEIYVAALPGKEGVDAVKYLKKRGVVGRVAKEFGLGVAPDAWEFMASRFDKQLLLAAGVVTRHEESGKIYDRFRKRLIFPIRDRRGRVLGFGGRVLDDTLPKYINSPETAVFSKGKEVYGLYELLQRKAKPQKIIVTEGYMDVIALAGSGVDNAVACLGTAISKAHIDLLFRHTTELLFCFDGDRAGRDAAWRAVEALLKCMRDGRKAGIIFLPEGQDPDSLVNGDDGKDRFENEVSRAVALSDYFFEQCMDGLSPTTVEGRAGLVRKARPYIEEMPSGVLKELMQEKLQGLAKLKNLKIFDSAATINGFAQKTTGVPGERLSAARIANALLLQNPHLISVVQSKQINWSELRVPGLGLLHKLVSRILANSEISMAGLVEGFRSTQDEKMVNALAKIHILVPESGVESEFEGALDRLLEQNAEQLWADLIDKQQKQGLSKSERTMLLELQERKSEKNR